MPRGSRPRSSRTGRNESSTSTWFTMSSSLLPCHKRRSTWVRGSSRAAELRGGLAHALGDGAHLAVALGQEHDDAVGLAQAIGAQDDAAVAEEAHVSAPDRFGAGSRGQ